MRYWFLVSVPSLLALASMAMGDFVVPDGVNYPWVRGSTTNSAYAQYEVFTAPAGPNAPDVGSFAGGTLPPTAPAWNVFDTSGGSFVTGGGNIYSPSVPTNIHVTTPNFELGAAYATTILLQVRTQGTEINPSSMNIGSIAPAFTQELFRQQLGGFGGFLVDTLYLWELPGNALSYEIRFDALEASMSLDRVAVDTFAAVIPAPGGAALLGLGGIVFGRWRRRT